MYRGKKDERHKLVARNRAEEAADEPSEKFIDNSPGNCCRKKKRLNTYMEL